MNCHRHRKHGARRNVEDAAKWVYEIAKRDDAEFELSPVIRERSWGFPAYHRVPKRICR